ncbi:MAG: pyridoxal-dependent decarboxylase [Balneolaceae bacterium]|nr:pyridoxal-dependent decarboxylase [Balneolaceae bacterium]
MANFEALALDMLGIGKKRLRKIPVGEDFRIDLIMLDEKIRQDRDNGLHPICAIGIAGTTNTGAIDVNGVADICRKHDFWFHVDAAYGGPAAALDDYKPVFNGMERAESLIVNPHIWMCIPFGAACVLVRNSEHMRRTFSLISDYLKSRNRENKQTDLMEYNLPLTKDFKGLKVWMTMKAHGGAQPASDDTR